MSIGKSSINRAGKAAEKTVAAPAAEDEMKFFSDSHAPAVSAEDVKLDFVALADILPTYEEKMITMAATFDEVVESVRKYGILIPMLLRRIEVKEGPVYRIIMGHKRFYAAQKLGLKTIPAEIIVCDDKTAAVIYNEAFRYDSQSKRLDSLPSRIVTNAVQKSEELPEYLL
ncbi:MAG: ParB N-terminal domain-containing protein [Clostridia bacterium]|nr:ParB N-terminal domain-containing protein [Clostridia bacterium]